jgi:ariadne-1
MKWNVDRLVERYYDGDAEKIFKDSGIANPKNSKRNTNQSKKQLDECTICFNLYSPSEGTELPCGHSFCNNCWREYLTFKIMDEGKAKVITCPAKGCHMLVDEVTVGKLITDPKVRDKYVQMIAQAYVEDNPNCRWCPGRGCQNAVRVKLLKEKEVVCTCGTKFCFGCGELPHAPADCKMVKEWKKKLAQEGETAHFLASYTKECPKCNTVIHKEGGCQYMTCAKCGHRFCWICLGAFDHVNHACNKYKEEHTVDKNSERAKLNKYMHYLLRYQTHDQSSKLEGKLMDIATQTMNELLEKGMSWIDVQFIKTATQQLVEARNMLKWTYVYGYYLPEHVNRDLFEYLQADLEAGTERLSGLLEARGEKDRLKIINATEYVKQRIKNLLEGLAENEITGGSGNRDDKQYKVDSIEKYEGWIYNPGK